MMAKRNITKDGKNQRIKTLLFVVAHGDDAREWTRVATMREALTEAKKIRDEWKEPNVTVWNADDFDTDGVAPNPPIWSSLETD